MQDLLGYFTNIDRIGKLIASFGGSFFGAILIVIIGIYIAKIAKRLVLRTLGKAKFDQLLSKFLANLVYYTCLVFVSFAAIKQIGVDTTSLLAALGAAGLAIGLAMEGSLRNLAAGVVLIVFRPFNDNDFVEVQGVQGIIEDVQLFNTILITLDNETVIFPNSAVTSQKIINFSRKPYIDVEIKFWLKTDEDIDKVREIAVRHALSSDLILKEPLPILQCLEFDEAGLKVQVEAACEPARREEALFGLTEVLQKAFREEGIILSSPTRRNIV